MKSIKRFFWIYLLFLTVAWWFTDQSHWADLQGFFAWRNILNQYTGVIGIGVMSVAMMLAVRPAFLERHFGGLDKMYRLHKWLGIAGLVISVSHFLIAKGPKWLVGLGWLERPARQPRPALPEGSLQQFFMQQRGLAEGIGEWAFYAALILMALVLIKRFPYKRVLPAHKLFSVVYLALVLHAVVLLKFEYWSGALGAVMAFLMIAGSIAAVLSLLGKRLGGKQAFGEVVHVEHQPALNVLAVDVRLKSGWQGHDAGQFAFITFHEDEGAHPFTIASAWNNDGHLRFLIKALGDYTRSLPLRLKAGDAVKLEGPYGKFTFDSAARRQIWIGGGIGITPFVSRMKALAKEHDGKAIDLFHATTDYDQRVMDKLKEDAANAGVQLHVLWDERDGRLDLERIVNTVPDWRNADVWFCGPAGFGHAIRRGLASMGLPDSRFHQELFEMR